MDRIAKGLEADGILTGAGKTKWWTSTINKILRNEKYIGDSMTQKTYTPQIFPLRSRPNKGELDKFYTENTHPAIINKEDFNVAQMLIKKRAERENAPNKAAVDTDDRV